VCVCVCVCVCVRACAGGGGCSHGYVRLARAMRAHAPTEIVIRNWLATALCTLSSQRDSTHSRGSSMPFLPADPSAGNSCGTGQRLDTQMRMHATESCHCDRATRTSSSLLCTHSMHAGSAWMTGAGSCFAACAHACCECDDERRGHAGNPQHALHALMHTTSPPPQAHSSAELERLDRLALLLHCASGSRSAHCVRRQHADARPEAAAPAPVAQ
jgi:hypothetical protein